MLCLLFNTSLHPMYSTRMRSSWEFYPLSPISTPTPKPLNTEQQNSWDDSDVILSKIQCSYPRHVGGMLCCNSITS